jgi:tyrosinase
LIARLDKPKDVPPTPKQGIRENIAGMEVDHPVLTSYRKAIEAMKKLPATNPLSWQFQANMHDALKKDGNNKGWRWCMHGNWWFLPWHRGYLYFFEKIVRKMSEDDGFRLPYWAWEKVGQSVLPAPFRDAKYQCRDNALFDATRVDAANSGQPLRPRSASGSFSIDWEAVLSTERFTTSFPELSYGGLRAAKTKIPERPASKDHGVMESRAHDLLHDALGDDTGNMGDPKTAARDPIFWLHHANVDRLWNRWLDVRTHLLPDPTADKDWYDQEFPFYDEAGKEVVVTVSQILELASKESRYDEERRLIAAAVPAAREKDMEPKIVSVGAIQPMLKLGTKPFTKPLKLAEDAKSRLMAALANPPADVGPAAVLLRVEGIKPPKDVRLTFEVFLMKKGDKPSEKSYVGPISFFGRRGDVDHGHDEKEGFTQGFDVTGVVQRLRSANKGKLPELEVSVVPHSTAGLSDDELAKKKLDIPISNITLKLVAVEKK